MLPVLRTSAPEYLDRLCCAALDKRWDCDNLFSIVDLGGIFYGEGESTISLSNIYYSGGRLYANKQR